SKTFYGTLNNCFTAMGQRLLRTWILHPLLEKAEIQKRLDMVEKLYNKQDILNQLNLNFEDIPDLERVLARIGTSGTNARDLLFLKNGLTNSIQIIKLIYSSKLNKILNLLPEKVVIEKCIKNVVQLIEESIKDDPALTITDGNIIKETYTKELLKIKQ